MESVYVSYQGIRPSWMTDEEWRIENWEYNREKMDIE